MRRVPALAGPIVLGALLATTPQPASGQGDGTIRFDVRPGTEIDSSQLGEFLAKNLMITVVDGYRSLGGERAIPLDDAHLIKLRMEMISREEGAIAKWESEAVKVEGGKDYPGSTFIVSPPVFPISAPGFGDRRKITFGRFVIINHEEQYMPRECEGATHALRVDVSQGDGVLVHKSDVDGFLCLNVES